jgi:sporulation protein YabP
MGNHSIVIDNREKITVTDVKSVDTFDEDEICAQLSDGGLLVKGHQLHIQELSLDTGSAVITGEIAELSYIQKKSDKSFLKKILK